MDVTTLAKDYILLQKRSFNNIFDSMALFQDCAEKTGRFWAHRLGFNPKATTAVDQWVAVLKQGRDASKQLVDDGLTSVEDYLTGIRTTASEK